jgi:4a-hydroxytetrahydrobiopterin dehydratase
MSELAKKKCVPCEDDGFPPLSVEQAKDFLPHVPGWDLEADALCIVKTYTFKDFAEAMRFANQVAELAEEQGHHPDLLIGWGRVTVTLSTHSIGGLSENDFILAAKIELLEK